MQYRQFGKLDWKASALGFGCMRLPFLDDDHSKINEPEALKIVRHAIDQGVNYLDTAYSYHSGNSERFVGLALKDGYRDKVRLATKMPAWLVKSSADFDKFLNEQLEKLQTDHIDFYLLHGLGEERWKNLQSLEILPWAEKAIASGRIRHLGFSFHDKLKAFKEIVDATGLWDFCQIQYNYMDINEQAGTEGLKYAASKGLAVVIMEPLLGGKLANPPQPVQALWDTALKKRPPVEWALEWLWNQPEVSLVLSGMSTLQQVEENLVYASRSQVGFLRPEELTLIDQVRQAYLKISPIPCTKCEYCLPCPNGLKIPRLFDIFNTSFMYSDLQGGRRSYQSVPEAERANNCGQCNQCEDLCPQHILISDWMVRVHEVLGEGKAF
jgi:predicted aldo/keto reductase-like oxidoreductase